MYLRFKIFPLFFVACFISGTNVTAQSSSGKALKVSNQTFDLLQEVKKLSGGNASIYLTITTHTRIWHGVILLNDARLIGIRYGYLLS